MLTRTEKEEEEDDDDEKEGGEGPGGMRARKARYGEGEQKECDARKSFFPARLFAWVSTRSLGEILLRYG